MAITINGSGITSSEIADGTITNADINASAGIAGSKLTDIKTVNGDSLIGSGDLEVGGGKVLQVVTVNNSALTTISTSGQSYMPVTITPTSASSKVLIMGNLAACARRTSSSTEGYITLRKDSAQLCVVDGISPWNGGASNQRSIGSIHVQYLDSPNTTNAITYKFNLDMSSGTMNVNDEGGMSSLTVMEIAQ